MDFMASPVLQMVTKLCSAPERYSATDIDVLVVGAGLGGLFAAIELWRHGHTVRVIECKDQIEGLGDFVGIAPSATRHMAKWPGMTDVYNSIIYRPQLTIYKYDGELLGGPFPIQEGVDHLPTPVSRPRLIEALYGYVKLLGIPVAFGKKVVDYWESLDSAHAGVVTEQGERFEADLVIAADGVGSVSWKQTASHVDEPRSSGFSVYRVAYPTSLTYQNPMLAKKFYLKEGDDDICHLFLGKNTHGIILIARETTTWMLTHKDHGQATELWNRRLDASVVLDGLDKADEWDEKFIAIIRQSPPQSVVDYKLLWRNPNPTWTSPGGLMLQLGDAAHSFLPTSANGATQAMEDAISIAACLRLAGKNSLALATRVHTKLRFQRVSCAQRSGFKNREKWHHTDFEAVRANPEILAMTVGTWITSHDPEAYVYARWRSCVDHITGGGAPFENTNIPPGYTYAPWTIDELLQIAEEERETVDPGNWS